MTTGQRKASFAAAILLAIAAGSIGTSQLQNMLLEHRDTGFTSTDALNRLAGTTGLTETDALNTMLANGVVLQYESRGLVAPASGFFMSTNEFQDSATIGLADSMNLEVMSLWRPLRIQYPGEIVGATFYVGTVDTEVTSISINVWRRIPNGGGKCHLLGNSGNLLAQITEDTLNTVAFPTVISALAGDIGASLVVSVTAPPTIPIDSLLVLSDSVWACTDTLWTHTDSIPACSDWDWVMTDSTVICLTGHWEMTDSITAALPDTGYIYTDSSYVCDSYDITYIDSTEVCVDSSAFAYTDSSWVCTDSSLASVDSTWQWTDSLVTTSGSTSPIFAVSADSMTGDDNEDGLWNGEIRIHRGATAVADSFNWYTATLLEDSAIVKIQLLSRSPQIVVFGNAIYLGGSSSFAWPGSDSTHKDTLSDINEVGLVAGLLADKPGVVAANMAILADDGGWTSLSTDQQLARFERLVIALEPKVVIIQMGQDDYGRVPIARTKTNIGAMLDSLDAHGIYPIVYTPAKINLMSAGQKASIDSVVIRTMEFSVNRSIEPAMVFMPSINSVYNGTGAYPSDEGELEILFGALWAYTRDKQMRFDPTPVP